MGKQELLKYLQTNSADAEYLRELQQKLNEEMEKPIAEQDFDLIDELTQAISVLNGTDQFIEQRAEHSLRKFRQAARWNKQKKRVHRAGRFAVCACAVLLASNVFSYTVYGTNAFSVVYQLVKGGVTFDLVGQEPFPEEGNPYEEEMRRLCEENDMEDVLLPSYIPAGFEPTPEIFFSYNDLEFCQNIIFNLRKNNKKRINLFIQRFRNMEDYIPLGIASDEHRITTQVINGTNIYIIKEDDRFQTVFLVGQTQYAFNATGLDYDECQRILSSMFTSE